VPDDSEPSLSDRPSADTGGGAHIYGNVYPGRDFIGRDQINLTPATPPYKIARFSFEATSPVEQLKSRPSWLLAAQNQVVGFSRRTHELAELTDWRNESGVQLSTLLIHGPGGQGKTRLATRFAHISADNGWLVQEATYAPDVERAADHATSVISYHGLLLIVDYAERWARVDLRHLFQDPMLRVGLPARVLLLARPAGQWWSSLQHFLSQMAI